MDQLGRLLVAIAKPRYEEDFVDRLNYKTTCWLLLIFSITLAGGAYVGKPLQCWVPAQFPGGWEQYAEDYCFVENTYFVPWELEIPTERSHRDRLMLSYYQWVPFFLALQALMFMFPHLIWRMTNWLSSLQVRAIIGMAVDTTSKSAEDREKAMTMISNHIHDSIRVQTFMPRSNNIFNCIATCGMARGYYVTNLYIFIKVLFIANLVCQFLILQSFLGPEYTYWGAGILSDLATNREWHHSGHFPRVTLCDFAVRDLANYRVYTVQCVLQINMFNEKVFLFLWWWFVVLIIVTILNFFYWVSVSFVPGFGRRFIERMLNAHGLPRQHNREKLNNFVDGILRMDGVFVLRLMSRNVGELVASHVVARVWLDYVEPPETTKPVSFDEDGAKVPLLEDSHAENAKAPLPTKNTAL